MRPQLNELTILRGLAACWVVVHNDVHFRQSLAIDRHTQFWDRGYLAVDFFLVLSGYVLAYVYGSTFLTIGVAKLREFLIARLARIYPLYLFLLLVRLGLEFAKYLLPQTGDSPPFDPSHSAAAWFANALMIQAWGIYGIQTWIPSFWSVSAEWFAYLCFPWLMYVVTRLRAKPNYIVACFLSCSALLSLVSSYYNTLELPIELSLLRCMPEFLMGVCLCVGFQANWIHGRWRASLSFGCILLGALTAHFGWNDMLCLFCATSIIWLCGKTAAVEVCFEHHAAPRVPSLGVRWLERRGGEFWQLVHRWLIYLGDISYAIYLCHLVVHGIWKTAHARLLNDASPVAMWLSFALQSLAILVVAAALHHGLERPARAWLRSAASKNTTDEST